MMESFAGSNCNSMSDSLSLYERYMRSFNVVDSFVEENPEGGQETREYESSCEGNIYLSVNKHYEIPETDCNPRVDDIYSDKVALQLEGGLCGKVEETNLTSSSTQEISSAAEHSLLTEKSEPTDVPVSSDDSKSNCFKHPVFITSTMENSNNAVDSVPLFRDVRPSESVFKLPISELSFNGTIKHVQKLKPIVDPITALTSTGIALDKPYEAPLHPLAINQPSNVTKELFHKSSSSDRTTELSNTSSDVSKSTAETSNTSSDVSKPMVDKGNESTGDSQYEEINKNGHSVLNEDNSNKWNSESFSSLEASFDSGVRSPDMFSDGGDDDPVQEAEKPFWNFLKDVETYDKKRVRKLEETLKGVPPPPSVTNLKIDVTEMLKKYYCYLPIFNDEIKLETSTTPTKRVSFVNIPIDIKSDSDANSSIQEKSNNIDTNPSTQDISNDGKNLNTKEIKELDTSIDKTIELKMCSMAEVKETAWPDVLKCRHHDVYYNLTNYSEKLELLSLRYGERFVGAETDSSVTVFSGGLQSPSSACKRKALRLKMAGTSPGRRLSHLARRRAAFTSAANPNAAKLVLIDKNFFPHRKLISSAERKSPRTKRTPGKKTPQRKTPGKKTPSKTPKSSSTKKKAMRRLLMDPENMTRSQPRENLIKRALFISPENRKSLPVGPSTSVENTLKSKRALFGSPVTAETKSCDGSLGDQFLKRKRSIDDVLESRAKIAKSLSFGGDSIGPSTSQSTLYRRSSEVFATRNTLELNENHKKKLLWAVSEALRVHGYRMSSAGFREKASALARLTRRLLALPKHRARLEAPRASTSETMLKLARQYVFSIIQGKTVDECYQEELAKLSQESTKLTGYISATDYQQIKAKASTTSIPSQVKENLDAPIKQELPKSNSKNILQDKLVNIDSNSSNSSSGMSTFDRMDKSVLFKSNSMPSFEEAAKLRARRQISFDNVEFPKR